MQVSYLTQYQGMNDLFFAKQSQRVGCGAKSMGRAGLLSPHIGLETIDAIVIKANYLTNN